jgi:hypothetical protein
MMVENHDSWPIWVQDHGGRPIYLTQERWAHALDHPGMGEELLNCVLVTLNKGQRQQDAYDPAKFKYIYACGNLPAPYTNMVVVVKFGWQGIPARANNFVLTAYLIERW